MLAAWVIGFVNALVHDKDAWASMPDALVLSEIAAILAAVATWLRFAGPRARTAAGIPLRRPAGAHTATE